MDIIIEKNAKEFIEKNSTDNTICVEAIKAGSGWTTFYEPSVRMGLPKDNRRFNVYESDGIKIYLDSDIRPKRNRIKIRLTRFLWKKAIKVDGIIVMK